MEKLKIIPTDIFNQIIMPFTYNVQNKNLLKDIKSYTSTRIILDDFYLFEYNYSILLTDLMGFFDIHCVHMRNRYKISSYVNILWGKTSPKKRLQFLRFFIH
jgi:hypothetical protein